MPEYVRTFGDMFCSSRARMRGELHADLRHFLSPPEAGPCWTQSALAFSQNKAENFWVCQIWCMVCDVSTDRIWCAAVQAVMLLLYISSELQSGAAIYIHLHKRLLMQQSLRCAKPRFEQ